MQTRLRFWFATHLHAMRCESHYVGNSKISILEAESACHAIITQVNELLERTSSRLPSFDPAVHVLPRFHIIVPPNQPGTESGLRHAIVTIPCRDLREAVTARELARQTLVPVPLHIDPRGYRFAATWWLQPRSDRQWEHAWRAQI